MTIQEPTREEKQRAGIKSVRVTESFGARVERFADENSMSVSEVIDDLIAAIDNDNSALAERKRTTKRFTVWTRDPERYARVMATLKKKHVPLSRALEAVSEGIL